MFDTFSLARAHTKLLLLYFCLEYFLNFTSKSIVFIRNKKCIIWTLNAKMSTKNEKQIKGQKFSNQSFIFKFSEIKTSPV